jgi:hypothetical protein
MSIVIEIVTTHACGTIFFAAGCTFKSSINYTHLEATPELNMLSIFGDITEERRA